MTAQPKYSQCPLVEMDSITSLFIVYRYDSTTGTFTVSPWWRWILLLLCLLFTDMTAQPEHLQCPLVEMDSITSLFIYLYMVVNPLLLILKLMGNLSVKPSVIWHNLLHLIRRQHLVVLLRMLLKVFVTLEIPPQKIESSFCALKCCLLFTQKEKIWNFWQIRWRKKKSNVININMLRCEFNSHFGYFHLLQNIFFKITRY